MKVEKAKTYTLPTTVLGLDLSEDRQHLYAACMDGAVYQVDASTEQSEILLRHESFASGVCRVPGTALLITSGYDGRLQWYDVAAKKSIRQINAHSFWSWQSALSADGHMFASVTGQYLAGSIKYDPAPETEPSVKVFEAHTGEPVCEFSHAPPVQAVAISPDSQFLAAGNLVGEIRVWDLSTRKELARWSTPAFTSWGIIKSHCFQGGIYSLAFSPDGDHLLACGMGPMRDPMSGNGKQTWQRFAWRRAGAPKVAEIHDGDHGGGHPESLAYHPSNDFFVMAGRLAQGKWNVGFFDEKSGALVQSIDTKGRLTKALFSPDGATLFLAGAVGQSNKFAKDGNYPSFGRIYSYTVAS